MVGSDRPPKPPSYPRRPPRPPRSSTGRRPPAPNPYIPPFRQRRLALARTSEPQPGSLAAQQAAWTALAKSVHGAVNRVSVDNVAEAAKALLRVNIVRARGLLCKTLIRAQLGSPGLAPVLASLVAVLNSRVPNVAALLVARLVAQLKEGYSRQDRSMCFATARFVACLYNQNVVSELLILEFLSTCLLDPSDGSVELAVTTLAECAPFLADKAPQASEIVFQRLREVLHEGELGRRAQVMIENLMARRRRRFGGEDVLDSRLDLLEEEDIITHFASLEEEEEMDLQEECNGFQFDDSFVENERYYEEIKREILGRECVASVVTEGALGDEGTGVEEVEAIKPVVGGVEGNGSVENGDGASAEKTKDMTDADLVDFRRAIYLTIHSGLSYEEWAHKLLKRMRKHGGREGDLCSMIIECCSQEKTYNKSYGLLGQRFCLLNRIYVTQFEETFATHYATIHRFDTRKIRNIACFYASLLASDALPWNVLQVVRLVEEETTSSSRIFLKYLFQEMYQTMGTSVFKEHFKVPSLEESLKGVFPVDTAENATFSINFFAKIGLGFLTEDLREKLKSIPNETNPGLDGDGSSSDSSSLSSSSLSSSSLSASSGEDNERGEVQSIGSKRASESTNQVATDRPSKRRRSLEEGSVRNDPIAERYESGNVGGEVSLRAHQEGSDDKKVSVDRRTRSNRDRADPESSGRYDKRGVRNDERRKAANEMSKGFGRSGHEDAQDAHRSEAYLQESDLNLRERASRGYSDASDRSRDDRREGGREESDLGARRHRRSRRRRTSRKLDSPPRRYYSDESHSPKRRREPSPRYVSEDDRYGSRRARRRSFYESDSESSSSYREERGYYERDPRRTSLEPRRPQRRPRRRGRIAASPDSPQSGYRSRRHSDEARRHSDEGYSSREDFDPSLGHARRSYRRSRSPETRRVCNYRSPSRSPVSEPRYSHRDETRSRLEVPRGNPLSESSYSSRDADDERAFQRSLGRSRRSPRKLSVEPEISKSRRSRDYRRSRYQD